MPQNNPKPQEKYKHFKGGTYQVITNAKEESTGRSMVVYQALYGEFEVYVRPLEEFISEVDYDKYPEATQRYRFTFTPKISRTDAEVTKEMTDSSDGARYENEPLIKEKGIQDLMIEFLDEDSIEKKEEILSLMMSRNDITDQIVDNLAAAIDVVIDDGDISDRMRSLRNCIRTRAKYESTRLRG